VATSHKRRAARDRTAYCTSCGSKVARRAVYCASCGHQLRSTKTPRRSHLPDWLKGGGLLLVGGFLGEIGARGGAAILALAFDDGEGAAAGVATGEDATRDSPQDILDFLQSILGPALGILAILACITAVVALVYHWLLPERPVLAGLAFVGLCGGVVIGITTL
jgi:hypothetical protein